MGKLLALFSGSDARTALIAISSAFGVVTYLGLQVASFVRSGAPFDGSGFGAGWGLTLGASAAAIVGHALWQAKADAIPAAPDAAPAPPGSAASGAAS